MDSGAADDLAKNTNALEASITELETSIDRQVTVFEKHDDPNHPVVLAAERRIGRLSGERERVVTERKRLDSRARKAPSVDLASILNTLADLRPALETYTDQELAELFEVFDLEARHNHREKTLKLSVTIFPELAELLECERPAEAGRSKSFIAGAGFEPATSGL